MSLQKIKYLRHRGPNYLDNFLKERYDAEGTHHQRHPHTDTLPKFKRSLTSSRISSIDKKKQEKSLSNLKLYKKINHQLQQIKEVIKSSITQPRHKRKDTKRKDKVITEISQTLPKYPPQHYYDVLEHISELKARNRATTSISHQPQLPQTKQKIPTNAIQPSASKNSDQKVLFYGVDYLDNIEFKIKIKLSKTYYHLYAKNNSTKLMLEMSHSDYMRLHLGDLKGNPCNIFRYLHIVNNQLQLIIRGKKSVPSLKSYLGYA